MNEKCCAFTICAKNYLAQALTLEESFKRNNPDKDFFLFLSDSISSLEVVPDNLVELDECWCPKWSEMAFKYNVIEFSTSIKPFCFRKLFSEGYQKAIYLDPDIYVTDNLDYIYNLLSNQSIVLTPHYNHIQIEYNGAVTEEELLFVGIYNLGFCGIKNDTEGVKIVDWWCSRLQDKCYADHEDALHVDQRWMDFVPGFFPDNCHISHHPGMNVAIWNLHERELFIDSLGNYKIKDLVTEKIFPLLFFHFSGFDPFNRSVINRRHPNFNVDTYPSFSPIINEYSELVIKNGYDKYHPLTYSFNTYDNGVNITPLVRRIFRAVLHENKFISKNIFSSNSEFYKKLFNKKLIGEISTDFNAGITDKDRSNGHKIEKYLHNGSKLFIKIFGVKKYYLLLRMMNKYSRLENQKFLVD